MENKQYVIRLGGNLYVATKFYGFFQDTTRNKEHAFRFNTYEEAAKVCRKTIGGKIEKYIAEKKKSDEISDLKRTVARQQEQIEQLIELIKKKE